MAFALSASSPAGLVALPCDGHGRLHAFSRGYCIAQRNYVTPKALAVLAGVSEAVARARPGTSVRYMEASWPDGVRPMPPHFSHGDGREVDLALYYVSRDGRPVPAPTLTGYGAYEPPRHETDRVCRGLRTEHEKPDPPAARSWRLDEARTADLIQRLVDDPGVRRIFIEPHLKERLGFSRNPKVRFAGCRAARHDDHIHVDFR